VGIVNPQLIRSGYGAYQNEIDRSPPQALEEDSIDHLGHLHRSFWCANRPISRKSHGGAWLFTNMFLARTDLAWNLQSSFSSNNRNLDPRDEDIVRQMIFPAVTSCVPAPSEEAGPMKEVRDPEYEQVIARAFALFGLIVIGTIVTCIWKIFQAFFQL
jgi:hypothetical protein